VVGWLRNSNGFPGFCFFADAALASMMRVLLKLPDLPFETLRETRQAIGLKKARIVYFTARKNKNGVLEYSDKPIKPEH